MSKNATTAPPAPAAAAVFDNVPTSAVRPHPRNVRVELGDVTELADSIRSQGVLQPLTVAPHPDVPGDWVVIAGHRRLTAARAAGLATVPVIVRRDLTGVDDQINAMLVENLQRTDLTVMEEADGYQALLDFPGWDVKRVAKASGRSQTLVRDRLKLRKLPDTAQDRVATGSITIDHAMAALEFEGDEETQEKILNAPKYNLEFEIRRARQVKEDAAKQALVESLLVTLDVDVVQLEGPVWEWREQGWLHRGPLRHDLEKIEADIKDGRIVARDGDGDLWWAVKLAVDDDEETDEQRADREQREREAQRIRDMDAGLQIAGEAREMILRGMVKNAPTTTLAELARYATLTNLGRYSFSTGYRAIAAVLGTDVEGLDATILTETVRAALLAAEPTRALAAIAIASFELAGLRFCQLWDGSLFLDHQLEALRILGYQLTDIEREVMAYWADKQIAASKAATP